MAKKEDAEDKFEMKKFGKDFWEGGQIFGRGELPAPSGLCDKNKHAILANRDSICSAQVVHYHGRLLGGQVVLDQSTRIGSLQKFDDEIPAPGVTDFRKRVIRQLSLSLSHTHTHTSLRQSSCGIEKSINLSWW